MNIDSTSMPSFNCDSGYQQFKQKVEVSNKIIESMSYGSLIRPAGRQAMQRNTDELLELSYYSLACNRGQVATVVAQKLWDMGLPNGDIFLIEVLGRLQVGNSQAAYNIYRYDFQAVSNEPFSAYWKYISFLLMKKRLCEPRMETTYPALCEKTLQLNEVRNSIILDTPEYKVITSLSSSEIPNAALLNAIPAQLQPSRVLISYISTGKPEYSELVREYAKLQYQRLTSKHANVDANDQ
ncbi:MAG TPA: hypothetical protein VNI53_04710 [Gammaproteobacteria bacterium]|nr:hypothetical protein [Gammaproteobacteria bacterium]